MNTMYRCALAAIVAFAVAGFQAPAAAQQAPRVFPPASLRGVIVFGDIPAILLDGHPATLAPGSRIRGADNFAVMPSAITGIKLRVNFTLDVGGNAVKDVWILTPAEREILWPRTPAEALAWTYDPIAHLWIKP
ncbi:MAG TPA: hypothetical protein VGM74_05540 [Burkholderiaceae bacterium]|jgi:hypothetical protein